METVLFTDSLEGFKIEKIRRENHHSMNLKHFHSHYEIYYLLSGERYYFIENRNWYVKSGDMVIVDSNQIHKTSNAGESGHERILLDIGASMLKEINTLFSDLYIETFLFNKFGLINLEIAEQKVVEDILNSIMKEMEKRTTVYKSMVKAKLIELFVFIIRKLDQKDVPKDDTNTTQNQKVLEIANYISTHFSESITLDKLSEEFYISKYYLCHTFKKFTGFTVNEYITANRMMQAQKQLLESGNNITQIAEAIGYGSVTNFDKAFKYTMGKSPSEYRRIYKEK